MGENWEVGLGLTRAIALPFGAAMISNWKLRFNALQRGPTDGPVRQCNGLQKFPRRLVMSGAATLKKNFATVLHRAPASFLISHRIYECWSDRGGRRSA